MIDSENKNLIVSKIDELKKNISISNNLVEAKYKLSLNEQRVLHILLSQIDIEDDDLKYYVLTLKDFSKFFNTKSKNVTYEIKNPIDGLMTKKLIISKGINDDQFLRATCLASAEYMKGGSIEIEISRKLKPYLIGLKKCFTKYNRDYILNFKIQYSVRIYQLLKQYEYIKMRTLSLVELKDILQVTEYPLYANFKKKIILVAQQEINEKSDIRFDFDEIKNGRKIESLKFYIYPIKDKSKKIILNDVEISQNVDIDLDDLIDELREFITEPIKTKDLKTILKEANNNVALIKSKYEISKQQSKIDNLVAWLIAAIKEDYSEPVPSQGKKDKSSKFTNYEQAEWDFNNLEELERQLVDNLTKNNI